MSSRTSRIRQDDYDVDARLAELGASRGWLIEAAKRGHLAWLNAPSDGFYGSQTFRCGDAALDELCNSRDGWRRGDHLQKIPACLNEDLHVAIGVTVGDANTGIVGESDPKTVTIKGPVTRKASERWSFADVDEDFEPGWDFFVLLVRPDAEVGDVFLELSGPEVDGMDDEGHVATWRERIIIGLAGGTADGLLVGRPLPDDGDPTLARRKLG